MGAAALGLALMAGSQAANGAAQQQSNTAMRDEVAAEDARQADLNKQLDAKQQKLIRTGGGAPSIIKQQAAAVPIATQIDSVGKNITSAAASNAGSAPAAQRGEIVSGTTGVANSSQGLAAMLARRRAMQIGQGDNQDALAQYLLAHQRLSDRAAGSQALLPYEMETAARSGDNMRSIAQLLALGGQGAYSYGINKPSNQPMGYSNSPYAYNRLQGPARSP